MTRIKFTPPLKNGINQHEMIIQRVSCPTSLRSWDSSTCQFQCATLLKLESLIPLRFASGIIRLMLQISLRSFSASLMDKAAGIFRQIISAISQGASAAAAANSFVMTFAADAF